MSSLRKDHAILLCIVPILSDVSEDTTIWASPSLYLGRYQTACRQPGLRPVIGRPLRPGTTPPGATSAAILRGVGERHEDSIRGEHLAVSGTSTTSSVVLLLPPPWPYWADCTKSLPQRNFPSTGLLRLPSRQCGSRLVGSLTWLKHATVQPSLQVPAACLHGNGLNPSPFSSSNPILVETHIDYRSPFLVWHLDHITSNFIIIHIQPAHGILLLISSCKVSWLALTLPILDVNTKVGDLRFLEL